MKILWHSNAPWVNTGYGSQTELFTPRIRDAGHDVAISAFYGLNGRAMDWEQMKVYPGDDEWGNRWVPGYAAHHGDGDPRAVVVVTLMDTWVLTGKLWPQMRVASWVPVDHEPCPPRVVEFFTRTCAVPIAMSRFGQRMLNSHDLDSLYVPHGVDTRKLRPVDGARAALQIPEDAFVVGMVAANKGALPSRKAFPQVFEAFAEIHRRHPESLLYLHTVKTAGRDGLDLLSLASVCGVPVDAIRWTPEFELMMGVEYEKMAWVYSAMDVLAAPSYGEGFGIPIVEAQACGTPVVVNDCTAMPELCGSGWKTRGDRWYDATQGAWFQAPSVASIIESLEDAYQAKGTGRGDRMSGAAVEFAAGYDCDVVTGRDWVPALAEVEARLMGGPPPVKLNRKMRRALKL